MKITVTTDDIENGQPNDGGKCPIALALQRVLPPTCTFHVHDRYVEIVSDVRVRKEQLPYAARVFIRRFDDMEIVEPFDFDISYS